VGKIMKHGDKKGYEKGGTVAKSDGKPLRKTAAGAQQMGSEEGVKIAKRALQAEVDKLGLKGFEEKHGRSYRSALNEIDAASYAERSKDLEGKKSLTGQKKTLDDAEKSSSRRAKETKNFAKGGMAKKEKMGYAKGGSVKTGHTDMRGKGLFSSSKSPRGFS
jgi:hypothetical protein